MKTKQNTNSSLMKNTFLLMLLFTGMVKAQIVNIPDANFKAFLIAANTTPCAYNQLDNAVDRKSVV